MQLVYFCLSCLLSQFGIVHLFANPVNIQERQEETTNHAYDMALFGGTLDS